MGKLTTVYQTRIILKGKNNTMKLILLMVFVLLGGNGNIIIAASLNEKSINLTSTSDNCGFLDGTWSGTYSFGSSNCGRTDCSVHLTFEDASDDGSAFFVKRPETHSCQSVNTACQDWIIHGTDYIAFCENSRVTMDDFEGLVSSTKLLLKIDGELDTYDMNK